jgi:hypothetical protein
MTPWRPIRASSKKRGQRKVTISWQRLGLRDPIKEDAVPIDEMRRQVDIVARQSLMRGTRSNSTTPSEGGPRRSRGTKH